MPSTYPWQPSGIKPLEEFLASVTRVSLFRRCPMAYYRRYVLKETEPDDPYAALGRAFHAYAAAKESGLDLPSDPLLPAFLQADWVHLRQTFDAQTFDDQHLVGVEEPVEMTWMDGETSVRFRGVMDRLEIEGDRARVWDRKTGYRVPNAVELRDDLQLTAYGVMVCHRYPQVQVVECAQLQYRYGGRAVTVAFTREELEHHRLRLVAEVGRMLRTIEFLPSATCTICPPTVHVRALQPYDRVEVRFAANQQVTFEVAPPASEEEALRVAQGVKMAEQLAIAGKKALARWSSDHGPVELGKGAYGHWGEERMECVDLDGYQAFLASKGLPARRYLRPDGYGLKTLLRRYPEASHFFLIQPGSKFGWRSNTETAQRKTEAVKELVNKPWAGNEG